MPASERDERAPVIRADDGQSERLHTFSHGLRNKLAGMYEALRLLREAPDDAGREEIARFAEMQFFQALREVEDLLDDFGVERGTGRLKEERVALDELAKNAITLTAPRLERKHQKVDLACAGPVVVQGDPYYLEELMLALLSNASKFSPTKAVIHVDLRTEGREALLTVRDTGVGLNSDDLRDIFTRFAWLSSRSTAGEDQGRGTLARVRGWVQAHGGAITAQSDGSGTGSTFTVRLPLAS